jgi:hypothetical protein
MELEHDVCVVRKGERAKLGEAQHLQINRTLDLLLQMKGNPSIFF